MKPIAILLAAALAAVPVARSAEAAEGASSHYLPGTAGDIAIAAPPKPGLTVANTVWRQTGGVGAAVLDGRVRLNVDLDLVLDLAAASYTWTTPIPNLTYSVAALVPFGRADVSATLRGPFGGTFRRNEDAFALSDIALVPIQLNWSSGDFHFKASQAVIAPTGSYDRGDLANLGRNYWSFDTAGAVTWLKQEWGTEISVAPGIMFNTENDSTNYRTGTEFHLDFTANQFLSPSFAIGLRGYWYQQLTGDGGAGARLGSYKSEAFGIGPGFLWSPAAFEGRLSIMGKWMHDLHAKNRFDSDYGSLGVAWKF